MLKKICLLLSFIMLIGCSGNRNYNKKPNITVNSLVRIAQKARASGNPDAAINFYLKVLKIDNNNFSALIGIAEAYIDKNLLDAATQSLNKIEHKFQKNGKVLYLRGKVKLLSGKRDESINIFMESKTLDSMNALGAIYDEKGQHEKAQSLYKQIIQEDPTYIDAYNNIGLSLLLCKKYNDAIFYLENACALPDANQICRSNLAMAYALSGNLLKAKSVYEKDFDGEELKEKVAYLEDLLSSKN